MLAHSKNSLLERLMHEQDKKHIQKLSEDVVEHVSEGCLDPAVPDSHLLGSLRRFVLGVHAEAPGPVRVGLIKVETSKDPPCPKTTIQMFLCQDSKFCNRSTSPYSKLLLNIKQMTE